ncbi:MAG: ribose-phosphate diphosphokinase [Candidatus Babeliales bacterium]
MLLFNTSNTDYLVQRLPFKRGAVLVKKFSDGELYVKLLDPIADGTPVCVIASTQAPAENLLELFFLLDALHRSNARIYVLFTYFGYARQDRVALGESFAAHVIAQILKSFALTNMVIVHAHSQNLHELFNFTNKIPFELFCAAAQRCQATIVAPDTGAVMLASSVAHSCALETVFISKIRPMQEEVVITSISGEVRGKNLLLVDDIIATGNTIMGAATFLKEHGAKSISVFVTHGVFTNHACERIAACAAIDALYVTNSLPQQENSKKIIVVDIVPFIEKIIIELRS